VNCSQSPLLTPLLVFDLDGTLVDTVGDIGLALNKALDNFSLPAMNRTDVINAIGDGVDDMLRLAVGPNSSVSISEFRAVYREHYHGQTDANSRLFPEVDTVLKALISDGYTLAVLTNKPELPARRVLGHFGIAEYFSIIAGPDTYQSTKPSPDGLLSIIQDSGIIPSRAVMIGDGDTDVRAGKAAGTFTISVTYGYRSESVLESYNPDAVCRSLIDVLDVVRLWNTTSR